MKAQMLQAVVAVIAACAAGPSLAARVEPQVPARPIAVAVLNFANQAQGQAEWDWLEKALADLLINDLAQHRQLQVVGREQMQAAILRLERDGGLLPEWEERLAGQLKATRAVSGTYRIDKDRASIQASVLDVVNERLIGRAVAEGLADNVLRLEKDLAAKVLRILTGQGDSEAFVAGLPVWTDSVPASRLLYEGVNEFDEGQYGEAWVRFRRASHQDPNYADAAYWSARMFYYQLRYEHAAIAMESFIRDYPKHPSTPDAIREVIESYLVTIGRADEAISTLGQLREGFGDADIYEPHGTFAGFEAGTMPAAVCLTLRIAQAKRYLKDYWGAWLEYRRAYELARSLRPAGPPISRTLQAICKEWDEVWVDGRAIASASPDLAYMVGPQRRVFVLQVGKPAPTESGACRMPWLVAEDGWLIAAITFRAVFENPSATSRVNILARGANAVRFRGADGAAWGIWQLTQPKGRIKPTVAYRTELCRGLRCVGFNADSITPDTNRIEIEAELMAESEGASLVVDDEKREEYELRLAPPGAGPNDYVAALDGRQAYRADLFPDGGYGGWRPGRCAIHFVSVKPVPRGRAVTSIALELRARSASRCGPDHAPADAASQGEEHRRTHLMADAAKYPDFVLANTFDTIKAYPIARDTNDGDRRAFVPPGYYGEGRACLTTDPAGRLFAIWHYRQDLWYALSGDGGRTWTEQQRLPVPVNSAHRELNPQTFRDGRGRYRLVFVSDRDPLHRFVPYVSTSTDLIHWTCPRKICDGESAYAFLYQDRDGGYVLVQDGRDSVWQRRSVDLATWTPPTPVLTCPLGVAMFRPYVVRGRDGPYCLLVQCVTRTADGRLKPWLVAGTSADGVNWSRWRTLGVAAGSVWDSYATPTPDGLTVYASYYEDTHDEPPKLACFSRTADGAWWSSGDRRATMVGAPGFAHCTPDGRILLATTDGNGNLRCVECDEGSTGAERNQQRSLLSADGLDEFLKGS